MEAPAAFEGNNFHAGLRGEGIGAATVFCGQRGSVDGGALKGFGGGSGGLGHRTGEEIDELIATDYFGMELRMTSMACRGINASAQSPDPADREQGQRNRGTALLSHVGAGFN